MIEPTFHAEHHRNSFGTSHLICIQFSKHLLCAEKTMSLSMTCLRIDSLESLEKNCEKVTLSPLDHCWLLQSTCCSLTNPSWYKRLSLTWIKLEGTKNPKTYTDYIINFSRNKYPIWIFSSFYFTQHRYQINKTITMFQANLNTYDHWPSWWFKLQAEIRTQQMFVFLIHKVEWYTR